MSYLFPAYSEIIRSRESSATSDVKDDGPHSDWLKNKSFVSTDADRLQLHHIDSESIKSQTEVEKSDVKHTKLKRHRFISEQLSSSDEFDNDKQEHDKTKHSSKQQKTKLSESSEDEPHQHRKHHHKQKKWNKKSKKHDHIDKMVEKHSKHSKEDNFLINPSSLEKQDGKIFVEDFGHINIDNTFYLDKSCDHSNYTYQSIYKVHIPIYTHVAVGLGSGASDINYTGNKNKKREFARYFGSKKKKAKTENIDDIPFKEPQYLIRNDKDFVRNKPILEEFMTLEENPSPNLNLDSSKETVESCPFKNSMLQKQEEYNRKLRLNPNNINLCLEFINFQDEFCPEARELGLYETKIGVAKSKKLESVIFKTKEAIFERFLKENPFSPLLKLAHLECVNDYWDSVVVQKEWKELLGRNINNMDVWRKYFDYIESKSVIFTVNNLLKAYKKCIVSMKKGTEQGLETTDFLFDTFSRMCYRLSQAGHHEKATALYQAQLEYNLFSPEDSVIDKGQLLEYFAAFWESSAARIGEEGAQGWKNWMKCRGNVQSFVPFEAIEDDDSLEQALLQEAGDKHEIWQKMELSRTSRHWLPWRPASEGSYDDCEDLERLVVSDDLTFALFTLNSPLDRMKLLCNFLELLGVPNAEYYLNCSYISTNDHLAPVALEMISGIFQGPSYESQPAKCHRERDPALVNIHAFVANIFSQTLPLFQTHKASYSKLLQMYVDFLEWSLVFGGLVWKREEYKAKVKETRSCMKKLLYGEPYRSSVLAWLRYALLEWRLGRNDDASKALYHTMTSLAHSGSKLLSTTYPHCVEYLLYRTYAEVELGIIPSGSLLAHVKQDKAHKSRSSPNKPQKSLQILVALCEGNVSSPSDTFSISTAQILRCKRHYEQVKAELLNKTRQEDLPDEDDMSMVCSIGSSLENCVMCYEMFVYITSGLPAAVEIHDNLMRSLTDIISQLPENPQRRHSMITGIKQRLMQSHIALLQLHIQRGCVPLRTIRLPILESLKEFPSNPNILWSYIQLQLKSSFTGDMRRYLAQQCRTTDSPLVWTLSLVAQLQRLDKVLQVNEQEMHTTSAAVLPEACAVLPKSGFIHTMRTWFQWAVSGRICRYYLLIWRLYLRFEMEHGKSDTAKGVFYEAIQHCPWAKCLYMDYLQLYPDNTQEVVDLMTEHEIRVHLPLEELDILLDDSNT